MSPALIGFAAGVVWFAVFLVAHILALSLQERPAPSRTLVRTLVIASIAAVVSVIIFTWGKGGLILAETYALLVMACLFVVYAPFFFTIYTSLSVESMLIARHRGASVPLGTLYERYASHAFIAARLATMVDNRYLVLSNGRYHPTPRGRVVAIIFSAIKRAWRLGPGG